MEFLIGLVHAVATGSQEEFDNYIENWKEGKETNA